MYAILEMSWRCLPVFQPAGGRCSRSDIRRQFGERLGGMPLDKSFDALFVGAVAARFTFFGVPVVRSEGNVQADVLSFSIFRQP